MNPASDEIARFTAAVAARLGLRLEPERASELIARRAADHRESIASYLARADANPAEIRALITELTVGETYFLRHSEQFRAFIDAVVPDRIANGRLRVLSAGCSTGEEPYTLAMLLRDAHPHLAFELHAVDLNPESIARARAARYSPWSLRATPPELEQRWFQREGRDVVVVPEIRARVKFEVASLLDDGVLTPGRWDVVFCRNVIMYFTSDRSDTVIARFAQSIAPGGFLFLGHAETLRDRTDDFALCHTHGAFYYQRLPAMHAIARTSARGAPATDPPSVWLSAAWFDDIHAATQRVHAMIDGALEAAPTAMPGATRAGSPPAARDLAAIRELFAQERFGEALERLDRLRVTSAGDPDVAMLRALVLTHAGRFAEARSACAELLALDPRSAGANYLLALCCDSTGDVDGAAHLAQIAAELDPSFAMPRVHLGLLARRVGARDVASRELTRAISLLEREAPLRLELYGGGFSRQALLGMCRAELAAIGGAR